MNTWRSHRAATRAAGPAPPKAAEQMGMARLCLADMTERREDNGHGASARRCGVCECRVVWKARHKLVHGEESGRAAELADELDGRASGRM